jgi:hypothetical protein
METRETCFQLVLVLCGSQITTMAAIMQHQSPLFGRFTGQWHAAARTA